MIQQLSSLQTQILEQLPTFSTGDALIEYRNKILGNIITEAFEAEKKRIQQDDIKLRLESEWKDMTIPYPLEIWSLHPITEVRRQVEDTFLRMGFDIYESMEITTEYLNFDAVNVPKTHPARDMQDTFWLEWEHNVLATQTSCMQNLILQNKELPIRAIIPGRVFRNEDVDATHDNTFYQVEWIVVDKDISMGHLKYTIQTMLSDIFGKEVTIRMRPGYFPFVEPGVEVDFSCPFCMSNGCKICKWSGWIEFMGAWLIHPHVIREGGLDPEVYTGFAFGFGLNRLVMIKYGIPDLRYFQNPDIRFLKQFP